MDNTKKFFYLSGLISISIFIILFILVISMLFSPLKMNSYALKKDKFISINIITPKITKQRSKNSESIDINNLFNDVWTKKIVQKKHHIKPKNSRIIREIQKKINMSKDNSIDSISKKINNIDKIKIKHNSESSSTALEVNEYLAKIQGIVYQYFKVPQNSEGNSVKTVIELSALGKVIDFRVLTYSNNIALNEEADKIKDKLKNIIFPKNPQNQSSRTIVVLISKE